MSNMTNQELNDYIDNFINESNFESTKFLLNITNVDILKDTLEAIKNGYISLDDIIFLNNDLNNVTIKNLLDERTLNLDSYIISDSNLLEVKNDFYRTAFKNIFSLIKEKSKSIILDEEFSFYTDISVTLDFLSPSFKFFNSESELISSYKKNVVDVYIRDKGLDSNLVSFIDVINDCKNLPNSISQSLKIKILNNFLNYDSLDRNLEINNIYKLLVSTEKDISFTKRNIEYVKKLYTTSYLDEELLFTFMKFLSSKYIESYDSNSSENTKSNFSNFLNNFINLVFEKFQNSSNFYEIILFILVILEVDKSKYSLNQIDKNNELKNFINNFIKTIDNFKSLLKDLCVISKENFI